MLELLFQGFIEWIYGLILECWEYFASVLFDLMSLDFAYLREHMPVIDTIRQIMLGVGWALLIGNLVFQATRGMAAGLGFDAEDPKLLFTRTFAFSFLLVASPQICELGLNMTSTVIELLQMPDAVDITFADEASFGGLTGSWLLVVICGIIVMFQTFKLIMEMAERYFILAVLTITSPLAFGMGGSRNTSDIFNGWCRMFGSMCLLMATNVMFVKMLLSVLSYYPSGLDVLPWMVLVITIVKVAKKADSILARIGLNPAMTGDPLGRGFPGAMTMMVVRSMVSNAAHTIGRNGNQPRSGSGNSKPNAPTGPRSGGSGSASNVNAPSHANGYHHSTSAQQNSANPAFNQESISAQTVAAQTDTVQSAAEKMAGAFPQAAPAGTGKQPNSTRKTAVPPGTRRAPGHVAAPKNNTVPSAGKTAPGAPYHHVGTVQPGTGSTATQNMQQEQTVHSQSESHPHSSTTVQNRGGTVLSGTAGKTAGQNPPRSTNQPTGAAGKSYHSSNAQGQTVQTESAQQRSTFVQPPDTQRGAPGMAFAPNAMPNNPASTSATPAKPGTTCRQRRNAKPSERQPGTKYASRIRSAAQYLCAGSEHGRRAASSRTSVCTSFSAIRYGRKSVCAAQQRTANSRTKRCGRKTPRFSFCSDPRYRRNRRTAAATRQSAECANARYGRNTAHVYRRALYPARAADDERFREWEYPDHAAEPCFCPAVQRRSTPNQRSPYGWPLHKSGASGSRSAVFQPRSWYTPTFDRAA